MIMGMVGNRRFTLTTGNGKKEQVTTPQERRPKRDIPRGTKFSHELSPNFSHPVEPQVPFGNGRKYDDLPYL